MTNHNGDLTPRSPPTSEGSTLRCTLQRFEKTWGQSTFRAHVGPSWDQPASLPSAAKYPETLSGLLPWLRRSDASISLALGSSSAITATTTEPDVKDTWAGTGVQWTALLAWRVWPLGDRATLTLLRRALIEAERLVLLAPWPSVRSAVAVESEGSSRRETGPLEKVYNWCQGDPREPASEWARELDTLADHAARNAGVLSHWIIERGSAASLEQFCTCAAVDVAASAYACALAFLLEDREHFTLNVYRMLRSAMGIASHAGYRHGVDDCPTYYEHARRAYGEDSAEVAGELLRSWPGVVALSEVDWPWDRPSALEVGAEHAAKRGGWTASRLRGWVPCLHPKIPPEAFEPYPNEKESEEP